MFPPTMLSRRSSPCRRERGSNLRDQNLRKIEVSRNFILMESLGVDKHNGASLKLICLVVPKKKGIRKLEACLSAVRVAEIFKLENHKVYELQNCTVAFSKQKDSINMHNCKVSRDFNGSIFDIVSQHV